MLASSSLFLAQLTYMQRGETINQCVRVIVEKKMEELLVTVILWLKILAITVMLRFCHSRTAHTHARTCTKLSLN